MLQHREVSATCFSFDNVHTYVVLDFLLASFLIFSKVVADKDTK